MLCRRWLPAKRMEGGRRRKMEEDDGGSRWSENLLRARVVEEEKIRVRVSCVRWRKMMTWQDLIGQFW